MYRTRLNIIRLYTILLYSCVADAVYHYDTLGTFMEPIGAMYTYSSNIIEKSHVLLPPANRVNSSILSVCPDSSKLDFEVQCIHIYDQVILQLQSRIDMFNNTILYNDNSYSDFTPHNSSVQRNKRAILALAGIGAGLMSSGLSLYNMHEVNNLNEKVQEIREDISVFKNNQHITQSNIHLLESKIKEINSIVIPELLTTLHKSFIASDCNLAISIAIAQYEFQLYNQLLSKVINGFNFLYKNTITPDLFPLDYLKDRLLSRSDMKNSYYEENTFLLYQLGKFLLISVNHDPFSLSGVIILPKLLKKHVYIIFSVNKVPILNKDNDTIILKTPNRVAINYENRHIVDMDPLVCEHHLNNYFCSITDIKHSNVTCIHSLLFSSISYSCIFSMTLNPPLIRQCFSGLLISPLISEYKVLTRITGSDPILKKISLPQNNLSKMITLDNGTDFIINDDSYVLPSTMNDITIQVNPGFHFNITHEEIAYDITRFNNYSIESLEEFKHHVSNHHRWVYCLSVLILILLIIIVFLWYKIYIQEHHISHVVLSHQRDITSV